MKRCLLLVCFLLFGMFVVPNSNAQSVSCSYSAGSGNPESFAFDNSGYVWVSFYGGNYVAKIQASATTCTLSAVVAVGSGPRGVAFDGTNIWVANQNSNNVTKVNPVTNTTIGTYPVGSKPWGIAYAGGYIYVSNSTSNNISVLVPATGALFETIPVGTTPHQVVAVGSNVWVANNGSNNVMLVSASLGEVTTTTNTGTEPNWLTFDGTNLWVSCWTTQEITKISSSGSSYGTVLANISVSGHGGPEGLAFDLADDLVWGVTWNGTLFSIAASTDTLNYYTVSGLSGKNLWNIAIDNNHQYLWVSAVNANIVLKVSP